MQNLLPRILICWSCLTPLGVAGVSGQEAVPGPVLLPEETLSFSLTRKLGSSPPPIPSLPAEDTISVRLASGRTFGAALDSRTDVDRLWLRFEQSGVEVLRPIDWQSVVSAEVAGQEISGVEFHRLVEQLRQEIPAGSVPTASTTIELIGSPSTQQPTGNRSVAPPVETRRVVSLEIDVRVGRWDENAESDGLVVRVYPLDARGNLVPVRGTLCVDLKLASRRKDSFYRSSVDAGHWSEVLRTADFDVAGAVCRLPFQGIDPEAEDRWLSPGIVHASLAVPGQGTFKASSYVPFNTRHFRTR